MPINFLQQDNAIFHHQQSLTKLLGFHACGYFFDLYARLIVLVLYGTNKILRAIALLFCSNFFQFSWCDGNSISFQLYLLIWGLICDIFSGWFAIV